MLGICWVTVSLLSESSILCMESKVPPPPFAHGSALSRGLPGTGELSGFFWLCYGCPSAPLGITWSSCSSKGADAYKVSPKLSGLKQDRIIACYDSEYWLGSCSAGPSWGPLTELEEASWHHSCVWQSMLWVAWGSSVLFHVATLSSLG